jgi:hypothetical protein
MLAFAPQKVIIYRLCGMFSLLLFAAQGWAGLPVRNQSPLAIYVGLPELKSAEKLDNGEQVISLNTTYNSHFIDKTNQPQPLFFDGESSVGDFFWRRGMLDWEWEISLPYISYQKGFMDSFVIKWHNAFGLPNANRSKFPKDKLVMSYDGLLLDHHTHGWGDMRITVGKQLPEQVNSHHAIHITLKLPTGDVDDWLGSGSTDLGVFSTHRWQQGTWQEELQFGLLGMETPDTITLTTAQGGGLHECSTDIFLDRQLDCHCAIRRPHCPLQQLTTHRFTGWANDQCGFTLGI